MPDDAPTMKDAAGAVGDAAGAVSKVAGAAKLIPGIGAAAAGVQAGADAVGKAAKAAGQALPDAPMPGGAGAGPDSAAQAKQMADAVGNVAKLASHAPGPVGAAAKVAGAAAPMAAKAADIAGKTGLGGGLGGGKGENGGKPKDDPLRSMAKDAAKKWLIAHALPILGTVMLVGFIIATPMALTQCSSSGSSNKSTERTEMAIPKIANMSETYGDDEDWWITGYGESKDVTNAAAIAKLAVRLSATARPEEPLRSIGPGMNHFSDSSGDPWYRLDDDRLKEYYKIIDEVTVKTDGRGTGANPAVASCTQFVGNVVRATADPDFDESGPQSAREYLAKSDYWDEVGSFSSLDVDEHLQPGDVICFSDDSHTAVYVGSEYAHKKFPDANETVNVSEAGYNSARYPEIVSYVSGEKAGEGETRGDGAPVVCYRFNGKVGGKINPYINPWKFLRGDSDYLVHPDGNENGTRKYGAADAPANVREMVDKALSIKGAGYSYSGYNWTGDVSTSVFTCSGVVDFAYGYTPQSHWPESLYGDVKASGKLTMDQGALNYGDLVFFEYHGRYPGHVGIYLGDGKLIDAWPGSGVQIRDMSVEAEFLGGGPWGF